MMKLSAAFQCVAVVSKRLTEFNYKRKKGTILFECDRDVLSFVVNKNHFSSKETKL